MRSGGRKSPSGVQGQNPGRGGRLGGKALRKRGSGAPPPEVEQVLMITRHFWQTFSNKIIYSIIRTLTSVLIFSRQL